MTSTNPGSMDDTAWRDDPRAPCEASQYCGNRAMTVRYNRVRDVRMCEACAEEFDEQE